MSKKVLFLKGLIDHRMLEVGFLNPRGKANLIFAGNNRLDKHCTLPPEDRMLLHLSNIPDFKLSVDRPSLVVSCICDADVMSKSLNEASRFIDKLGQETGEEIPVLNHPDQILRSRRSDIYDQFHALFGLTIPKTVYVTPESVRHVLALTAEHGIEMPFLMRPAGRHEGKGLVRVDKSNCPDVLERFAYDGQGYYISQFVDTRGSDGLYRKLRVIVVDGYAIPRHFVISEHWMVHAKSRFGLMAGNAQLRDEERAFLSNFQQRISNDAKRAIFQIHRQLGLAFFGIDCSIDDRGNLTVFEINSAIFFGHDHIEMFRYLKPYGEEIERACDSMIRKYAQISGPTTVPD